jgi:heterodisulfide reductase subunit A-like polyferredoxin
MGREEGEDAYAADLRQVAIRETAGVFVIAADADEPAEQQALKGAAVAARASVYLGQVALRPRGAAVVVNSKLCRGCGNCTAICSYVELEQRDSGIACARVDRALCLGCGACVAHCPTGAMSRPEESDGQIGSALEALLGKVPA